MSTGRMSSSSTFPMVGSFVTRLHFPNLIRLACFCEESLSTLCRTTNEACELFVNQRLSILGENMDVI